MAGNSAASTTGQQSLAVLHERFCRLLYRLYCGFRPLPADDLQLFVLQLVSRDEEFLELLQGRLGEVADVLKALLRVRAPGHSEQTVVSFGLALALLLYLKDADDAARQNNPWKSRRIVNHHDIDRIAVIGLGRRHETPIVRIGQSGEKRFGERE